MTDRREAGQSSIVEARGGCPAERPRETPGAGGFRAVYEAEFSYVWRTLRRLGVKDADLEDVAHDMFVVVHRRFADYDPARPVRPWLFGIALRVASEWRRRGRARIREMGGDPPDVADPGQSVDERLAEADRRRLVLEALQAVEVDRRAVLVLHDIDGHAAPEIADALGIPLNTAYSRLRLARADFIAAARRLRRMEELA